MGHRLLIDSLYYGPNGCTCCSHTHHGHKEGFFNEASVKFNTDVLAEFLRNIYHGFDTSNEVEPAMWREILRIINEATVEGLSKAQTPPTHDKLFYEALRHSNEVFAAFKVHTMGVDMAAKLFDSKGKLKPFKQWVDDVSSISSHQVGSWLQTEYDTAVIRAHQAADWREFMRNKDVMPNLRWMPTTSPDPETTHEALWQKRLNLPVDDPFWTKHHPGDHWNCKCSLEANDDAVVRPEDISADKPQPGLDNNPGKDGHIFNDTHPYFPSDCQHCPFNKGFKNKAAAFFNNKGKHCNKCNRSDAIITKAEESVRKAEYHKYRNDLHYKSVEYDKKSGGVKAIHVGHIEHEGNKAERFFDGLTSSDLERECQDFLFKRGKTVVLCDESKKKNGNRLTALDMELDGIMMDIRSITGKGWYSSPMDIKNKQLLKYNARPDVKTPADTVCFYFHDPKLFDPQKMKKSINFFKYARENDGLLHPKALKHIICVIRGNNDIIEYNI